MTWPSLFPPGSLGYMQDRIDDDLARSGTLSTEIAVTINDAINIYQKQRFRFSETRDFNFNCAVGQEFYNATSSPVSITFPSTIFFMDYLTIQVGFAVFDVPRYQPEEIEILTQTGTQAGQPYAYSFYNETIRLYPVPSAVYLFRIGCHQNIPAPTVQSDTTSRWMNDGERLIRSRAKFELAQHVLNDADLAARMSPMEPEGGQLPGASWIAFKDLKAETNKLTGKGIIRPMYF